MKDLPSVSRLVKRLGYSTAAVYIQLYDLYRKQRRLQGHYHAGHYWVRMPYKAFPRMFSGLPAEVVSESIEKLEEEGLLRTVHYGHLCWYVASRKASACRPKKVLD